MESDLLADHSSWDEEMYKLLLHKIVKLYLTVRGHSYASNLMEKHKQAMAKGTQRAKALHVGNYMKSIIKYT